MKRPALHIPASLLALQPPEVRAALAAAAKPARRRPASAPVVPSARVEAGGAVVLRVDGLRLVGVANAREHHFARSGRVKNEHAKINAALRLVPSRALFALLDAGRWVVTITRESAGVLDDDNLAIAGKGVRDAIGKALGCGDAPSAPVAWRYAQRRAKAYAVEVRVEVQDAG